MKSGLKKKAMLIMFALLITAATQFTYTQIASASTTKKDVVIVKVKGNTIEYHKSAFITALVKDPQWENIVGYGKKYQVTLDKNAKFYVFNFTSMKTLKVSKSKFIKKVKEFGYSKGKEKNVTYYFGMACKLTIKNGKCVKVVQQFQS